jgi:hypothetical protein
MVRKKAKMGRPPRHEGERLSKSRTFRVRPHLDELLMTAAAKAGRSVSEEIEYRLDRSFYEDALSARMAETMAPLVEQAARAGGEAALKVHLAFSRPETEAERQERATEYSLRLIKRLTDPEARIRKSLELKFEGAKQGRKGLGFEPWRKLLDAFGDVHGRPANTHAELSLWALESPQGKAALDKIMEGKGGLQQDDPRRPEAREKVK